MKNRYAISVVALALTISAMPAAFAQTTEPTQDQEQPQATEQAPAAAEQSTQEQPARQETEAAPEPAKEDDAQPSKKKKIKKQNAEDEQPAKHEAAPEPVTEPVKQEAAPASEPDPAKQEAAPASKTDPAKQEAAPAPETDPVKQEAAPTPETDPVKQEAAPTPETDPVKQEAAPTPETDSAKQEAPPAPKATDPAKKGAAQPQSNEPAQQQAQPAEDTKPAFTAISVLGDERPPAGLTDAELRQRIQAAGELADSDATKANQKARLKAKAEADTAELNARTTAATGVTVQAGAADAEAAKIVGDTRPAAELDDKNLRDRIKQTRGVLAAEGLSDASTEQLRASLATDTAEIRQRVAAKQSPQKDTAADPAESRKANDLPEAKPGKMTVDDLISDTRPAKDLTANALERRIDANRRALTIRDLPGKEQALIRARLEEDRDELGERLIDRRKRRKRGLSRKQAIAIGAGVGLVAGVLIASRPTIAAAEAYDEELEEWLISPPLVRVKPRYRIEDFAEQPRLRYSVPGIEIDTIRFGFGEGFLRTEEVSRLDRIGGVIERIIASNPTEVFLIEGHTDAVGSSQANLALSTERAEAVKQALLEYFEIGEDNLATVGRGEAYPKIPTQAPEAENRRVTLRRITPLLANRN